MIKFNSEFEKNPEDSVGLFFIKAYNKWHRLIKKELEKLNITHPQYVVLASLNYLLSVNDEVKQVDISKHADIDVVTLSEMLKLLEKKKLINREYSKTDSRSKIVTITKNGLDTTATATSIVEKIDREYFGKLSEERITFLILLKKL